LSGIDDEEQRGAFEDDTVQGWPAAEFPDDAVAVLNTWLSAHD
jgi:hypothetical protein